MANPDIASMAEDSGTITLSNLLTNDTDAEGDPLTVTSVTGAVHGTIAQPSSGVFTYTPDLDFNGVEMLNYTVSDFHGGTGSSTVKVTVTPVNDPPVANNGAVTDVEDAVDVPLHLVANDTDVDGDLLTATSVSTPAHGTVTQQPGGAWTYTPDPDWNGVEVLSYAISDGNGGTASANVTVTITPTNDPPVANPNAFTIAEDSGPLALNVTGNDTDADGDTVDRHLRDRRGATARSPTWAAARSPTTPTRTGSAWRLSATRCRTATAARTRRASPSPSRRSTTRRSPMRTP